jgi:hypothetical protein
MTPITRSRFRPRYPSSSFAPGLLFLAGEQGAWYDPSDLSTLFQDAAGTVPVTAVGQPVGLIRDKSGRGNNASQSVAGSRPTLNVDSNGNYFLLFDGIDDSLLTSSINLSSTNKITVFAGLRKLSDAGVALVAEFSATIASNNGAFAVAAPLNTTGSTFAFASKGTLFSAWSVSGASFAAPSSVVLSGIGDISTDTQILRLNGADIQSLTNDQGTGNYGTYPLYIGRRNNATFPYNGRMYGLIVRGAATSSAQVTSTERWMAGMTGVAI